jgi:hypothetical protein
MGAKKSQTLPNQKTAQQTSTQTQEDRPNPGISKPNQNVPPSTNGVTFTAEERAELIDFWSSLATLATKANADTYASVLTSPTMPQDAAGSSVLLYDHVIDLLYCIETGKVAFDETIKSQLREDLSGSGSSTIVSGFQNNETDSQPESSTGKPKALTKAKQKRLVNIKENLSSAKRVFEEVKENTDLLEDAQIIAGIGSVLLFCQGFAGSSGGAKNATSSIASSKFVEGGLQARDTVDGLSGAVDKITQSVDIIESLETIKTYNIALIMVGEGFPGKTTLAELSEMVLGWAEELEELTGG